MRIDPTAAHTDAEAAHLALLDRVCAGDATSDDVARLQTWLADHPSWGLVYERLIAGLHHESHYESDPLYTEAIIDIRVNAIVQAATQSEHIAARASLQPHADITSSASARKPIHRTLLLAASAALLLLVGVFIHGEHSHDTVLRYQTAPGQRSTVQLSDGSTLILAPATSVSVSAWGIDVTGEAYFTVAPRSTRPFIVRTTNAAIQVLGTRFSVRHYQGDTSSRVVVEEGRVALQDLQSSRRRDSRTVLSAHMMAFVTDSGVAVSSGIATREYTDWTRGTLVFNRAPLRDVVAELSRAYGADIRVADSVLAKQRMRLDVSVADEPITQVLGLIGEATDAHVTRDGQAFILAPGRSTERTKQQIPPRHQFPQPEQQYGR